MLNVPLSEENLLRKIFLDLINVSGKQSWLSLNSLDIQSAFSWFQRVIDSHIEDNFPKRTFTMNYKNRLPWLTEKLRNQIKDKNAMHTMVILNPGDQQLCMKYKKN